jgi:hypothetical protein
VNYELYIQHPGYAGLEIRRYKNHRTCRAAFLREKKRGTDVVVRFGGNVLWRTR